MIRNLNQVTFRCFGSVPSERTQTDRNLFRDDAAAVRLSRTEAVVYRAASETRISCGMGMSVLSASTDGETYQRFYLDKPAIIRKGVYFLLEPFQGDATVMVSAQEPPEELGRHAPGSARVEMCACFRALEAEGAVPALCVSGWEVEQAALGRRNYTVLTLEMLARTYPEAELYMAMGSDMLLSFDSWHRWQEILRLARLVVTSRNVGDAPELHAKAKQMDPTGARILFAQVEALPMASSSLRARLAAGEACENELPALVRRVIRREGLYRADRGESGNHESETGKGACARSVE